MRAAARTAPHARRPAAGAGLPGTSGLLGLILRRDRARLVAWVGVIAVYVVASAAGLPGLYENEAQRQVRAELMRNPGVRALAGPGYGLDRYTFGAMIANELMGLTAVFVALMSLLLVVRHTRAEEESGRAELVRAGAVGPRAHLAAALAVAWGADLALGALVALGLGALRIEGVGWEGSWLFGAALASVGIVFASVAAITAQLGRQARTCSGIAGGVLAAAYLLRAAGDMTAIGGGTLSWLSPIGWAQQTRAFVADRWWPLLPAIALAAALAAAAARMTSRRDLGAAPLGVRPGPSGAPRTLSGPLGLAWRLQRGALLWWGAAAFASALGYGSLAGEVERFAGRLSGRLEQWLSGIGGTLVESWLAVVVSMAAVAVSVFAVHSVLRLRAEEDSGRAEPVLAAAVSRTRWAASHVGIALLGGGALLLLTGTGLGLSASRTLGEPDLLPRVVGAALAYVPALWVTAGAAVALFGLAPRRAFLAWVLLAHSAFVGILAGLLRLPDWVVELSPFSHVPMLPADSLRWTPLGVLTGLAAALVGLGLAALGRRDVGPR